MTSDLDEFTIAGLSGAPVDAYGVGTALVTGSGHPTSSFVYKLVARADSDDPTGPLTPVAKRSQDKPSLRRSQVRGPPLTATASPTPS